MSKKVAVFEYAEVQKENKPKHFQLTTERPKGHDGDFFSYICVHLQYFCVNPNPNPYCEGMQKWLKKKQKTKLPIMTLTGLYR